MIKTEEYLKIYYSDKEEDIKLRKEYNKNLLEKYQQLLLRPLLGLVVIFRIKD